MRDPEQGRSDRQAKKNGNLTLAWGFGMGSWKLMEQRLKEQAGGEWRQCPPFRTVEETFAQE